MMDAGLLQDATLNSRVLEIDNTDYNQELLCEVSFLNLSCQQQLFTVQ
jgi:hypothetical protein